jgi:hypothetical protein
MGGEPSRQVFEVVEEEGIQQRRWLAFMEVMDTKARELDAGHLQGQATAAQVALDAPGQEVRARLHLLRRR